MTQDHLMMRSFTRINKSTSGLTSIFQNTSIGFLKDFGPQCITGKMCICHLFRNGRFQIFNLRGRGGGTVEKCSKSVFFIPKNWLKYVLDNEEYQICPF